MTTLKFIGIDGKRLRKRLEWRELTQRRRGQGRAPAKAVSRATDSLTNARFGDIVSVLSIAIARTIAR